MTKNNEVEQKLIAFSESYPCIRGTNGYIYCKEAVILVCENPMRLEALNKDVYTIIGDRRNTTLNNIRRIIEHFITDWWDLGLEHCGLFPDKPSTKEFLIVMEEHLRLNTLRNVGRRAALGEEVPSPHFNALNIARK